MAERYIAILAGGSGTRLWPLSRGHRPKQLLALTGEHSLLRDTFDRVRPLAPPENVFVLTERSHADDVREHLPEVPAENVLVEPARRGTGGALGLAALIIHRRSPGAVWASVHSDHFIRDDEAFRANLDAAFSGAAQLPHLFTLGIVPTFPSSQLGYVQRAEELIRVGGCPAYRVERFVEKPSPQVAAEYLASGEFYWNAGIFAWSAASIRAQFERQLPDIYAALAPLAERFGSAGFQAEYDRVYPALRNVSIDVGIMERAPDVAVIPASFNWVDVGSWNELYEALAPDGAGNVVRGRHVGVDTSGCLVFGGRRLIATVGLEDMVIVETDDALFIGRRDRAADVRRVVEQLEREGRTELL
jgi:mannose-1-phosphate guanylyltransferase